MVVKALFELELKMEAKLKKLDAMLLKKILINFQT